MLRLTLVVARWRSGLLTSAVVAVAFGVISVALAAAGPESPRFTRLSVEDGLSQSSVEQILQDRRGLLWFGTQEGLNRYDGYRFTVHRTRDQQGFLRDHEITALIEDARGDLWVGTSKGLYRHNLETGRFDSCAPPVDGLGILELVQSGDSRPTRTIASPPIRTWRRPATCSMRAPAPRTACGASGRPRS